MHYILTEIIANALQQHCLRKLDIKIKIIIIIIITSIGLLDQYMYDSFNMSMLKKLDYYL